jgi:2,4'-dihydroxyacetophenone dioxygenase
MDTLNDRTDAFKEFIAADPPIYGAIGMRAELVGLPSDDPRIWMELEPDVWTRPLMFDMTTGSRCEILRVRKGGILSRHRHPSPVHGFVLKGEWRYLEHSWIAKEGSYVFEPPGEEHTLTCDACEEMETFFFLDGPVLYVDDNDNVTFVEDNLSMIRLYREHYDKVGLGADFVDQLIR